MRVWGLDEGLEYSMYFIFFIQCTRFGLNVLQQAKDICGQKMVIYHLLDFPVINSHVKD